MNKSKINFWVDAAIGMAFVCSAASGVVFLLPAASAAEVLGISMRVWSDLHTVSSLAMIAGVGLHLVLHWRWIVTTAMKTLLPATGQAKATAAPANSANAGRPISRRAFLSKAAGATVGMGVLLAGSRFIRGSRTVTADPETNRGVEADATVGVLEAEDTEAKAQLGEQAEKEVRVACSRGLVNDPYPGRCRRYRDANGNGVCDYSEPQ